MKADRLLLAGALALWVAVLLRTAWVCDDSFITMRAVDHLVRGEGANFNVGERVQAYSHPLWMALLVPTYALSGSAYWTVLGTSLVVSAFAAAVLAFGVARSARAAAIVVAAWSLSRAAVDFSTGGLENPLAHLLVLAYVAVELAGDRKALSPRARAWLLPAIAGLGVVTRHDLAVLFAPLLLASTVRLWREGGAEPGLRRRVVAGLALGGAPIVLWSAFSLVYYGSVLPNPAYAKQFGGIARNLYLERGFDYLWQTVRFDVVTAAVIATAAIGGLCARGERGPAIAAAILLHLAYVAFVGGDFMRGRFLTVAFVLALAWLASGRLLQSGRTALLAAGAIVVLGMATTKPTVLSGREFGARLDVEMVRNVHDERAAYYRLTGLFAPAPAGPESRLRSAAFGRPAPAGRREVAVATTMGFLSFSRGPSTYVIDRFGLADPLLARLPVELPNRLRVGHLMRAIPDGYWTSVLEERNALTDPRLAEYYEHVRRVVRGPLFTAERWSSIWKLHSGELDRLVEREISDRNRHARAAEREPAATPPRGR